MESRLEELANMPSLGCFLNHQVVDSTLSKEQMVKHIFSIGGKTGWYYMHWTWHIRGVIDKLLGGVGLQRGRADSDLKAGDALDFWRVALADQAGGLLLLYAEMKVPGEAWLEFKVEGSSERLLLRQTACFRPRGVWGRFYWYSLLPIHLLIFRGMARKIAKQ